MLHYDVQVVSITLHYDMQVVSFTLHYDVQMVIITLGCAGGQHYATL